MDKFSKIFILSPHIDDAAFGLALSISKFADNNIPITIINCFTVTKWTAIPVQNKEISAVSKMRKDEDAEFYRRIDSKIHIINLDLLDAPLRNGYIFQNQPFQENELELIEQLENLLPPIVGNGLFFCPLAIGNHIDHAICREAVIRSYKKLAVLFFEDLPYAQRIGEDQIHRHLHQLEDKLGVSLTGYVSPREDVVIDKKQVIRIYQTQVNEEIISEIEKHLNALNGERLWAEEREIEKLKLLSKE